MKDDEFKRIEASLSMFDGFADELETGFSFEEAPGGFSLSMEFIGGEEKELAEGTGRMVKLGPMGGGPFMSHTHEHSHLLVAVKGVIAVRYDDEEVILNESDSCIVDGSRPHSVWNTLEADGEFIDVYLK